jgi:hypothetical protein
MKTDDNRHNFTGCHLPFSLTFSRTVFEQLFTPLSNKYFAKIINITKQLNSTQLNSTNLLMPVPF